MGTHACTRIQNNNDFIEMHTRWDGFSGEIKNDLKSITANWKSFVDYFQKTLDEKQLCLPYVQKWIVDMNQFLASPQTIEKTSSLLCSKSFNHHHVLNSPTKASEETLNYFGANSPDVLLNIETMKFNKRQKINHLRIQPRQPTSEFNLLRVADFDSQSHRTKITSQNYNNFSFTDFKYHSMTEEEVEQLILSLPIFWLELYFLARQQNIYDNTTKEWNLNYTLIKTNPILRLLINHTLESFYSPNEKYSQFKYSKNEKTLDQIIEHVSSMIPFDFFSPVLGTHLYLASAGKIQPLTFSEQLWAQQINNIKQVDIVQTNSRTNQIFIENKTKIQSQDDLNLSLSQINNRFDSLCSQIYPSFNFILNPTFKFNPKGDSYFDYEKNMIVYFHLLTLYDIENK